MATGPDPPITILIPGKSTIAKLENYCSFYIGIFPIEEFKIKSNR
jgi:hypothetical protein